MKSVIITVLLAISALAQAPKPGTVVDTGSSGGGGGGTGTVTSVTIAGTTNQITATGTCVGTVTITCTLSLPSGLILPGTVNGLAITTTTGTITIASAKVLTVSSSLNFLGTDGVTLTFPTTNATIARTDEGQTFTGDQTMTALLQAGSTAPTQTQADNSTKVATTAYVDTGLATKGTGTVSGLTANCIPKASGATALTGCAGITDDGTTVTLGAPLVGDVLHAGGAYLSATPDANGGGPNQCPIWWWGDNTCVEPAALTLNTDIIGDLSAVFQSGALQSYAQFEHNGVGQAEVFALENYAAIKGTGPTYIIGIENNINYKGTGHVSFMGGLDNDPGINNGATVDQLVGTYNSPFIDTGAVVDSVYGTYTQLLGPQSVGTLYGSWDADFSGKATNAYYGWNDSQGVRRVKEDNTFNAVGQAIEASYNPQFTKYTPGASNFERGVLGEWESNVFVINTEAGGTGVLRNIAIDGAEVDLGTSSHLVNIEAATFTWNGKTCILVGTTPSCS